MKSSLTSDGIYIRRSTSGGIELSKMINGNRVRKIYMFYTVHEALSKFRSENG